MEIDNRDAIGVDNGTNGMGTGNENIILKDRGISKRLQSYKEYYEENKRKYYTEYTSLHVVKLQEQQQATTTNRKRRMSFHKR